MIRSRKLNRALGLLCSALMLGPTSVLANPQGGVVAGGQATIQGQGTATVTVTQGTQNAIINWNTFNISAGEHTQFIQPSATSIALNRVLFGGPSLLNGTLTANGRIILVNPNGVLIGSGGVINTAGFLASTNDIRNSDFMAGNYKFTIPGRPDASIVNLGQITATDGGFAALVAPGVRNAGVITANLGNVALASGNGFTLDFYGDKLITLQVGDEIKNKVIDVATGQTLDALVKNEGLLKANGGQVALTAAAARHVVDSVINNTGVIEANSVGMKNGMIVLGAATAATKNTHAKQTVKVSGTLSAAGQNAGEKGGVIQITGERIVVRHARLDASGQAGGGTVLVGGDTGGGTVNPAVAGLSQAQLQPWAVPTASSVSIDAATVIDASATVAGHGGKVVVWSNGATSFNGAILANGAGGGSGGFVETSGHTLQVTGSVSAGSGGVWLLDPVDLTINSSLAYSMMNALNGRDGIPGTDVIETTSQPTDGGFGNITVNAPITWHTNSSLTLSAYNDIILNASLTSTGGGAIKLRADNTGTGSGTVTVAGHYGYGEDEGWIPAQISTSGRVTIFYNPGSYDGENQSNASGGNPYSQYMAGDGKLTAYMLVNTATDLQNIGANSTTLNGVYALGRDIDVSGSGIANFTPLGTNQKGPGFQSFTGIFDGQYVNGVGPSITNLNIAPTANGLNQIGLFAFNAGTLRNLHLSNVTVTANPNAGVGIDGPHFQWVGTLAGENSGKINHVIVDGGSTVTAGPGISGIAAGGLVGENRVTAGDGHDVPGKIKFASSNATVTIGSGCSNNCSSGTNYAGGLVGINGGIVNLSAASGTVTVGSQSFAGGLVGQNANFNQETSFVPRIKNSFATGDVTSGGVNVSLGGLVGANGVPGIDRPSRDNGWIKNSYATGHVTATADVNNGGCSPGNCQSVNVGGLVGQNWGLIQGQAPNSQGNDMAFGGGGLPTTCGLGGTCASGSVSAGAGGQVGGLVGFNDGIIKFAYATGDVHVGTNGTAGGLVGFNMAIVDHSSASGDVTVGANSFGGGLVGTNQNNTFIGDNSQPQPLPGPVITDSWASGNVSSNAPNVSLGGLVGYNAPLAVITTSFAQGNVKSTATVNSGGNDCSATNSCQFANVGGLVGQNQGEISGGKNVPTLETGCGAGQTCATGLVSVGAGGTGGGLVGFNDGIILNAFATGNVTGAPGPGNNLDHQTNLGGLVGSNQGMIGFSFASGSVGTAGVASLNVGGLVGDNGGMIANSFATGSVQAGDRSTAGGLAGDNGMWDGNCGNCVRGEGFQLLSNTHQFSTIFNSHATGNVTVGAFSLAGGLVAGNADPQNSTTNPATIAESWASGVVRSVGGGGNSIIGGLVGFADVNSIIADSHTSAPSSVSSDGLNSIVGGFIGVNGGAISSSQSAGGVNGTSNSYLGGFVGINVGSVQNSTAAGNVSGAGSGNVVGGFVGLNAGLIDPSTSSGTVSSGPNSTVGNFAGINAPFSNLPPNSIDFPNSGSTNPGPQVGSSNVNGNPGLPSIIPPCGAATCQILVAGLGSGGSTPDNPTNPGPTFDQPPPPPPNQQVAPPPNNNDNNPIQINLTTPGPTGPTGGGAGDNGGNNGGTKPNYGPSPGPGLGRTADEQQYSGVPPPNETRFRVGELVIQVVDTVQVKLVVDAAAKLGLVLISTQHLDQTRRNLFRFRASNPKADLRRLIVALEKVNIFASVQPNYNFIAGQTAQAPAAPTPPTAPPANTDRTDSIPPPNEAAPDLANSDTAALQSLPAGDAAQYVIDKLHLGAVHRLASGRNVTIAVIDSEIDVTHPDLRGVIIDRFDATQSASKPHTHGTGMAGAIASRFRLLGVAPGVRIIAIKAFDESATSAEATSFQILKGLDYAINKNVRIINMSFAGPRDPMMERTLKSAHDKGTILIAAAGNAGPKSPPLYPGADQSVIAVSATDFNDKPFVMANRGKYIAVAAPGVDVMVPAPGNGYQLTTGTSVAAAHVSGVAALLVERKPTITPDEVRAILMKTATAFSSKPKGEEDGAGLVDPAGALQILAAGAKTSETVPKSTVH